MRLKALKELGYKDIPDEWVKSAKNLTEDEARRFIIADNVGFGEHDWEILKNEWDVAELNDWGLEIPDFDVELLEPNFDELTGEIKDKNPTIKITFKTVEQLQQAENDIQELLDRKYKGAYFSVSAGEI